MKLGIIPPNTKACPNGGIPELSNDFLVFDHVTKRFGALTAVNDVSFSVNKGEFFSLLGPSGCGKTTLLRMLGGFEKPDSGRIFLEGKDITDLAPNERRVHTVFQNYALFPTMTIWDNIAFSLRLAKLPKKEIEEKVDAILAMIQMSEHAWKYPNQLSGGQKTIHDQVGITFMYVTHDQGEAMSLSDRIAVINRGTIEQLDGPAKIYEAPSSRFVASFIGDTNFFSGEIVATEGDYCTIRPVGFPDIRAYNDKQLKVGQKVDLSVRPEKIRVTLAPPPPEKGASINVYPSTVQDIVYQGVYTKYWIKSSDLRIAALKPHSRFLLDQEPITWNDKVFVWWHPDDGYMVEAKQ